MITAPHSAFTSGGNVSILIGATTLTGTFYAELLQVLFDLRWAVLFIVMLVITDFWSGLVASVKVRKENFRISRALRRTIAKFLEYISYIIFGLFLAKGLFEPFGWASNTTGAAVGAGAALLIEADSIYGHICDIHGIKHRFSLKRLFVAYIRNKNESVGEALEETLEEKEKDK